jgi:hypothetical protein
MGLLMNSTLVGGGLPISINMHKINQARVFFGADGGIAAWFKHCFPIFYEPRIFPAEESRWTHPALAFGLFGRQRGDWLDERLTNFRSDHITGDDKLHAPVLLTSFGGSV